VGLRAGSKVEAAIAFDPGVMPGTGLAREANGFERFMWMKVLPKTSPVLRAVVSPHIYTAEESTMLTQLATGSDAGGTCFIGLNDS